MLKRLVVLSAWAAVIVGLPGPAGGQELLEATAKLTCVGPRAADGAFVCTLTITLPNSVDAVDRNSFRPRLAATRGSITKGDPTIRFTPRRVVMFGGLANTVDPPTVTAVWVVNVTTQSGMARVGVGTRPQGTVTNLEQPRPRDRQLRLKPETDGLGPGNAGGALRFDLQLPPPAPPAGPAGGAPPAPPRPAPPAPPTHEGEDVLTISVTAKVEGKAVQFVTNRHLGGDGPRRKFCIPIPAAGQTTIAIFTSSFGNRLLQDVPGGRRALVPHRPATLDVDDTEENQPIQHVDVISGGAFRNVQVQPNREEHIVTTVRVGPRATAGAKFKLLTSVNKPKRVRTDTVEIGGTRATGSSTFEDGPCP